MSFEGFSTNRLNRMRTSYAAFAYGMRPDWKPTYFQTDILAPVLEKITLGDEAWKRTIVTEPFRYSKPLAHDTLVLMGDGSRRKLGDIAPGDFVITRLGRPSEVQAVHRQGPQPIIKITTYLGREVFSAPDHPFLTPTGYVKAGELAEGQALALLPAPAYIHDTSRTNEEFAMAGYFVGDGCTTEGKRIAEHHERAPMNAAITNVDPLIVADIERCSSALGWGMARGRGRSDITYSFSGGVRDWLRESGLAGCTSHTKRVPPWVFRGSPEQIAVFLAAYFDCDGYVTKVGGKAKQPRAEFCSMNRDLLRDVQHLLLRCGVSSRLRDKKAIYSYDGKREIKQAFVLYISDLDNLSRFAEEVPLRSAKAARLAQWGVMRSKFDATYVADYVERLEWQRPQECSCLTVAEDESFLAEDLVVHNTEFCVDTFIPFYFGHNPDHPVILVTYGANLSKKSGRVIREIMKSELYRHLFPEAALTQHSRAANMFATVSGGQFYAGSFATGVNGLGARLLLVSDPHKNLAELKSETINDRVRETYKSAVEKRCEPNAAILVESARWTPNDLVGWRVEEDGAWDVIRDAPYTDDEEQKESGPPVKPTWKVIRLQAEAQVDEGWRKPHCECGLRDDDGKLVEHGEPLWPEHWTCKANQMQKRDADSWQAHYLLKPTLGGGYLFAAIPPQFYRKINVDGMNLYLIVDPSRGKGKKSDYTAMIVVACGVDHNYYVVDLVWVRAELVERMDHLFRLHRKWHSPQRHPLVVGYEEYGLTSDSSAIKDRQERENYRFPLIELGRSGEWHQLAKGDRISTLAPLEKAGRIFYPDPRSPEIPADLAASIQRFLDKERNKYPAAAHEDVLDALSRINDPALNVQFPMPQPEFRPAYRSAGTSWMSA